MNRRDDQIDPNLKTKLTVATSNVMTNLNRHLTSLHYIVEDALRVAGQWNGDEAGSEEDRAHLANEIVAKADELRELIEGMEEL